MFSTPGTVLLCIDLQRAILRGLGGPEQARLDAALEAMLARLARLQALARQHAVPLVHVQHGGPPAHRLARGTEGWGFLPAVAPAGAEAVVHKQSCDAFHDTSLLQTLGALGARRLIVAGCMTQYCIDTTCRRAVSLGYDVTLVADGHLNAGSAGLTFEQVIAHHNELLDGFNAGSATIRAVPARVLGA